MAAPDPFCGNVTNSRRQYIFPENFSTPASCTNVFNQAVQFQALDAFGLQIYKNGVLVVQKTGNSWNDVLPLDYKDARGRPHFVVYMLDKDRNIGGSFEFGIRCNFDATASPPVITGIDGLNIVSQGSQPLTVNFTSPVAQSGQFLMTVTKTNDPAQGSFSETTNGAPGVVHVPFFDNENNTDIPLHIVLTDASGRSTATDVVAHVHYT